MLLLFCHTAFMLTSSETIILIPTYNEAENIGQIIDRVFAIDPELSVMVLDDSSPDGTAKIVRGKMSGNSHLHVIERTGDKGFARSYIDGFQRVAEDKRFALIITMDADFSHEPKEIPAMLSAINRRADMVVGSRYAAGQTFPHISLWRRILSRIANRYVQFILHVPVTDCTSGFIAFRTSLI
ncbi:MAG: glycosyltransferase, partial [Acidobacteriota bacterium]